MSTTPLRGIFSCPVLCVVRRSPFYSSRSASHSRNYRQVPPEKAEEDKRIDDYNYFYNNDERSVGLISQ